MKWYWNKQKKLELYNNTLLSDNIMDEITAVHKSYSQYRTTPLWQLSQLSQRLGVKEIYLKDESYRFGLNSFKVLGGSYAMQKILQTKKKNDKTVFITATDGNHGKGVAWVAQQLHKEAYVLMPKGSSSERLENIQNCGANAWITECNYDETVKQATELAKKNEWILVQDTAFEGYERIPNWIMQGYSTMVREAYEQMKTICPTHVFLQAGVGSMAAGVIDYLRFFLKENCPKIIIVESGEADCLFQTAKANDGKLHKVDGALETIMAGLACGEPSVTGWNVIKNNVDCFVSIDDCSAANAIRILCNPLFGDPAVYAGESGAAGMGAFFEIMEESAYSDLKQKLGLNTDSIVLSFVTEGITDSKSFENIVWKGAYSSEIKK